MAPKAQAFGFNVIACDPYAPQEVFDKYGVKSVSMEELYETSDFISVHAPLLPETKGLVNMEAFKKMKKTAVIVNTARGPLINEKDLIQKIYKTIQDLHNEEDLIKTLEKNDLFLKKIGKTVRKIFVNFESKLPIDKIIFFYGISNFKERLLLYLP